MNTLTVVVLTAAFFVVIEYLAEKRVDALKTMENSTEEWDALRRAFGGE